MPRADLRRAMRERMALSLAESEARHRALLSALPEGVVLHDTDGSLLLANPAACMLLGLAIPRLGDGSDPVLAPPSSPGSLSFPGKPPGAPDHVPSQRSAPQESAHAQNDSVVPDDDDHVDGGPKASSIYGDSRASHQLSDLACLALATGLMQRDIELDLDGSQPPTRLLVTAVPLMSDDGQAQAAVTTFVPLDPGSDAPIQSLVLPEPVQELANELSGGDLTTHPAHRFADDPASETSSDATDSSASASSATGTNASSTTAKRLTDQQPAPTQPPPPLPGRDLTTTSAHVGRAHEMFRLSMQHSPIGFAVVALNGRFLRVNRRLCRMLGFRADELQERTLYEIIHPADLEETSIQIGQLIRGDIDAVALERRYVGHGGMQLWGMLCVTVIRDDDGTPEQFVVQIEDISEVHQAQQLLTHMTLHDTLTGLPNRTLVLDRIQKALDRASRTQRKVAVLLCDVDHFRVINDSAGHEQGDQVLVEMGRRLAKALKPGDTAGRLGGDEFVVVCEDVAGEHDAVLAAERIQAAVTTPLLVGDRELQPTVSIGIAVATASDIEPTALLRDADIATYRAKDRGRNRWDLVDAGLRRRAIERLDIEYALRSGLESGDLRLHFQPIVDLSTRKLLGAEALVRWQHPEQGLLAPGHFLPVAEESGLIGRIGEWVLTEAARAAAASPESAGYVSINVSPSQVAKPGLADLVEKSLATAGLPPERLIIELTESVMLSAAPSARKEIELLDAQGVRIMVDDFGTGFSALSYLRDLPVSGIKVDRSFTAGLGEDPQCDRIVEALTGLGHGLGVDVIVEGVETEEQSTMLTGMGAQHAQGYLFGRPGPDFVPVPA